jgi:uroporphyrin-III C-methyltransferase / precorrin-2 dehydrogenase / sirohydrochlorin ferrochelatase
MRYLLGLFKEFREFGKQDAERVSAPVGKQETAMRYFPVFVDLKGRKVTVVGGGEEALRKVRLLLKTEADIAIVAPDLHDELKSEKRVRWIAQDYKAALLDGSTLVYSAEKDLNAQVSADAQVRGIPVNAVDEAEISTFIVPSIVDRDPVVIAIGTEGTAPVLAQGIRSKIDALLPQKLGSLARAAATLRERVAKIVPAGNRRRSFWQEYFFGGPRDAFLCGDAASYELALGDAIYAEAKPAKGRVSIVGAGPGDPELLTLKAHRKIQEADVIVHDRLVSPAILEMARRDAVRIPVGKKGYEPSPKQNEINDILYREAAKGLHVVRLKGGDPYVFGRGGEEQASLTAKGIAVDVVPGITAALGCAASVQRPLTQRGHNLSVTLLTGASEDGVAKHDWKAFASIGGTFAIYMGINNAGEISASLLDAGVDPATFVTVVENGTLANERVLESTVGSMWETVHSAGIAGPALIYVGLSSAKASADIVSFPVREDIRDAILRAAS